MKEKTKNQKSLHETLVWWLEHISSNALNFERSDLRNDVHDASEKQNDLIESKNM